MEKRAAMDSDQVYDVLVAGGGNAALCAAITARTAGAKVLVLESSPKHFRGGNSRHTRNLRCMHDRPSPPLTGSYTAEEYWRDLSDVTDGHTNEVLARMVIAGTASCREWMIDHGVRFQPSLGGALHLSHTNAFFRGGGKSLINAYYRTAHRLGVDIEYDTEVRDIGIDEGRFEHAVVVHNGQERVIRAKAFVAASGGFQANLNWLREAWGDAANNFIIRGTPYDTGVVLRALMDRGVKTTGEPTQCHAVAIDGRSPRFDSGIVTRVDAIPLGIVVNTRAERFRDEGEDLWPKRYAIWGRLVAQQPDQTAFVVFDAQAIGLFIPPMMPPVEAASLAELGALLDLDPVAFTRTVSVYNDAVQPGTFDRTALDSCTTQGVVPPKSHWARRIDTPPYYAYPLRPGITFTYLAVVVDERARIVWEDDTPARNVFAAGEIMAGNILGQGYLAGLGMSIGTVFGRKAGEEAARSARDDR
ncbi:MAG: FAD-dependent tricarballylate dehydrogenase TcuA [Acidobacteriota bacterium]|nr:FAD-dependent tricarballylate dehydrogenase TcuA [Acidobacteriota bacterium]